MNYFSDPLGISNIPNFLVAKTPAGLRRLMRRNNVARGGYVDYKVMVGPDGRWYAWYVIDINQAIEEQEQAMTGDAE